MYDFDSPPPGTGRRGLPVDETDSAPVTPRRGAPRADDETAPHAGSGSSPARPGPAVTHASPGADGVSRTLGPEVPRRAAPSTEDADGPSNVRPWFRGPGAGVVLVAGVIVAVALWSLVRPAATPHVAVAPTSGSPTTVLPSTVLPSTTPPAPSPTETTPTPATAAPSNVESAPPLPATVPPEAPTTVADEPSPEGTLTPGLVELNDARFMGATGWTLYGDEVIEEDRRAVRLSNEATDVRLQAVTLLPRGGELGEACRSLVEVQQTQFTDVTRQLVSPIGIDPAQDSGVRCGFAGVRSSDGVANTVSFTLVSRASDSHVLMLRSTIPDALPEETPAVAQLLSMSCQASASFGVPLPLC